MPTLLIIDDEPDMRDLISMALEMTTPWTVRTVGRPDDALDSIRKSPPDGLVLDVLMPAMDGPTLLEKIRELPEAISIPAVFLSGHAQPAPPDRLAALGVKGVIQKPFDPHLLGGELARLFGWQQ
jgi:CheY-like chemotaxis protein